MDQEEQSYLNASDEEATEVQYLLVEPQNHHASVDGVLCFHKENLENCTTTGNFSGRLVGGPDPNANRERGVKLKVLDEMPHRVQPGHLQHTDSILNTCEDYLIDVGFSEGVAHFNYDSHLEEFSSERQISGFRSDDDDGTIVVSDSVTTTLSPGWKSNSLEKITGESNRILNSKHEFETSNEANYLKRHTSSEPQNAEKQKDVAGHLVRGVISDQIEKDADFSLGITLGGMSYSRRVVQNDDGGVVGRGIGVESFDVHEDESSCQGNNVCARFSLRRSRKPTRRYIDESSEPNSKYSKKRPKISTSTSATKSPRVGSDTVIKSRTPVLCSDESFIKAIQVPFDSQVQVPVDSQVQVPVDSQVQVLGDSQVRRECRNQHTLIEVQNTEISRDKSKHNFHTSVISKKVSCQRKHKLWTIAEVRNLIDGVSQFGVGKWTEIKRLLFSSSAHRTPVDLKDKWRNLIKASYAEEQRKKEMQDEKRRNQPWRPLPKSVLRRVRELAVIYPCPCYGKSEHLHTCQVSSPTYSAITGSPLHVSGEKMHRKTVLE